MKINFKDKKVWLIGAAAVVSLLLIIGILMIPAIRDFNNKKKLAAIEEAVKVSFTSEEEPQDDSEQTYTPAVIEKAITDKVSYTVISCENDKVILQITAPDMKKLLLEIAETIDSSLPSDQAIRKIEAEVDQALKNGNYSMVTTPVMVDVQKVDGNWEIVPNEDFVNAIYGNMLSLYTESISQNIQQGVSE
ncbi:MAG: hypothetical protein IJN34_07125 [Clostridia bacterium]|nr:hypothetical protein [Clostridia bacterium]